MHTVTFLRRFLLFGSKLKFPWDCGTIQSHAKTLPCARSLNLSLQGTLCPSTGLFQNLISLCGTCGTQFVPPRDFYVSVNSSCAHAPPPGQHPGIRHFNINRLLCLHPRAKLPVLLPYPWAKKSNQYPYSRAQNDNFCNIYISAYYNILF